VAHLEAGQKLGSENVTASTMTLVPGCGNRMIVPSEKKERVRTRGREVEGSEYYLNKHKNKDMRPGNSIIVPSSQDND